MTNSVTTLAMMFFENWRAGYSTRCARTTWSRAKPLPITVSVGLALSADFESKSADEILACADAAL
jgi:GGDEF domain-containing protein